MLRVVCANCGKKLEIPDAWARNTVKCPQCREPIDLKESDSAECAVKLGQFLNENLAGGSKPGDKAEPAARPSLQRPAGPLDVLWRQVQSFAEQYRLVVKLAVSAALLFVLDATWLHTGIIALGAAVAGGAAAAAWKSERNSRLPSAAKRAEIEYKVAIGLVVLLGLRLAWFCYSEISEILATENLASVAPAFELLPRWGAILAVVLVAAIPVGAALGCLPLVQRFSIYHVVAGGLVVLSLGYGVAEVVAQQMVGVGVGDFVRQRLEPPPALNVAVAAIPAGGAGPNSAAVPRPGSAAGEGHLGADGVLVETSAQGAGGAPAEPEPEVVAWTATADPPQGVAPKIDQHLPAIHLGSQPWNPVTPTIPSSWLAVGDNRTEQSVRKLWDLSQDSLVGELAGQIEFIEPVALSADEPLVAGFVPSGALVEVWSLAEGRMIGRLACGDVPSAAHPFIAFVAPETLLLVTPRGTDPQTPPVCQIWNFIHDEMLAEFPAIGASADPKNLWAISPGRKFLAAFDKSVLRVYDLTEHRLVGRASIASGPTASKMDCAGLAFAPDGRQLTAIFHSDKKSRLLAWDMSDGAVSADGEFNSDLARGAPADCRPIVPLGGGAGWLVFERIIVPAFSGPVVRAATVNQPQSPAAPPRLAKVLDSKRLLVIANDALQIVKLPSRKQGKSKELVTLAQLLNDGAANSKPGGNQRPLPGAGQSADGALPDSTSRAYARGVFIDFLSSDDDRILEQVRWAPWSKRPVFGVRLGLGVLPTNVPPKTLQTQQIEPVTGAVGPKLVAALDDRLDAGVLGTWPPGEDSRLTRVGWLGIGSRSQMTATAKRQDADVMVVVNVNWGKSDQRQITVRIVDTFSGSTILNSSTVKVASPTGSPPAKGESTEKWLTDLLRQVDQKMTLQPLPELTADDAKQAAEQLVAAKHHDLPADLTELRTYQALHLIDESSAAGYYEQLLGAGMGEAFAHGDADERHAILEKVLPAD